MNSQTIGEYLKRLRVRAKYTQSDLGAILNVTDKAISRWESGLGTPEISNLMAIAKLYNITVDDILNCNEAVFGTPTEAVAEKPAEKPAERSKVLPNPSENFGAILLFAYIVFGIYIASYWKEAVTPLMPFLAIYSVLIVAAAVISVASSKIPKKALFIIKTVIESLFILNSVILATVISLRLKDEGISRSISAIGCVAFAALFAVRLVYTVYDFTQSEKIKKALLSCALGAAGVSVILAVISTAVYGLVQGYETDSSIFNYINVVFLLVALAAFMYALGQLTTKSVNIVTLLLIAGGAAVAPLSLAGVEMNLFDGTVIAHDGFTLELVIAAAAVAPFCSVFGGLFVGSKNELVAARITAVISVIALVPFLVYTFDAFAVNVFFGYKSLALSEWLRLTVFAAAFAEYVRKFRLDLLFKGRGKI